jgi:hypothetical protein
MVSYCMKLLQTWILYLTIVFLSCKINETKTGTDISSAKRTEVKDNSLKPVATDTILMNDTIKRFVIDDYPVTYEMMAEQKADNYSSIIKTSGQTKSLDKAWFTNDTLKQTLIFELYTDGHRLVTYHFYNNEIPDELFDRIILHTPEGEVASKQQKTYDFKGFLTQSVKINSKYFTTDKGLELGDYKQKILNIYGRPDKITAKKGIEKLAWNFAGDILYDGKVDLKGKSLAKDSYGHQAYLFFKNRKLIAQVLYNDIP